MEYRPVCIDHFDNIPVVQSHVKILNLLPEGNIARWTDVHNHTVCDTMKSNKVAFWVCILQIILLL